MSCVSSTLRSVGARWFHTAADKAASIATRMEGKAIADGIREEIGREVEQLRLRSGFSPALAMVRVGNSPQSRAYSSSVQEACSQAGITSHLTHFPASVSELEVLQVLQSYNNDEAIHGVVVQLPLPTELDAELILRNISICKDVDGLHPMNLGNLAVGKNHPSFVPCTPLGCMELLRHYNVELERKNATIVGCSNVVGLPIAFLLQRHNATVTIVDKHTPGPSEVTRNADILISATGNANLVRGHWIKPGAVVIDVGVSMVEDVHTKKCTLSGDVCFEEAEKVASLITPVPGGVGPMTVAMLLSNTLLSAQKVAGSFIEHS